MNHEINNDRSHKVLATLAIIDALDFNEDDLSDLTSYLVNKCGFELRSDLDDYDRIDHARDTDTSILQGKKRHEILEESMKELQSIEVVQLAMPPVDAYNIVAIVQGAIVCLDLPKNSLAIAKEFVYAFCDRYRNQMPVTVQCINAGWDKNQMVTEDEFEESLVDKSQRIAHQVEEEMNGQIKIIVDTDDYLIDDHTFNQFFGRTDDDLEDRCASGFTN